MGHPAWSSFYDSDGLDVRRRLSCRSNRSPLLPSATPHMTAFAWGIVRVADVEPLFWDSRGVCTRRSIAVPASESEVQHHRSNSLLVVHCVASQSGPTKHTFCTPEEPGKSNVGLGKLVCYEWQWPRTALQFCTLCFFCFCIVPVRAACTNQSNMDLDAGLASYFSARTCI